MESAAREEMANSAARWLAKKIVREFDDHGDVIFPQSFADLVNEYLAEESIVGVPFPLRLEVRRGR